MSEHLREILKNEQEHQIDLATALGKDVAEVTSAGSGLDQRGAKKGQIMANTSRHKSKRAPERPAQLGNDKSAAADHSVEEEPGVERGERIDTGKTIARGGGTTGPASGATEQRPEVVMPPAPPGESAPEEVENTRAVADALAQLGEDADPKRVAKAVKAQTGKEIELDQVVAIRAALRGTRRETVQPGPGNAINEEHSAEADTNARA